ncbi:MAG: hypothetical protein KDA25_11910 [Phycisphaerales bacterium]|nr:hypothetical protein [Phycisphaerales bacterium]
MRAEELVKAGDVGGALKELQDAVRKQPANAAYRVFLFQLLSVLGQWERAITQLNVASELDTETALMGNVCRSLLNAEAMRADVFAGRRTPLVFGEPEEWIGWLVQANQFTASGHHAQASDLRAQAFEAAPAIPGTVNGHAFEWIADADTRLGPMTEIIIDGRYYWIPISRIHRLATQPPQDLRDLVWCPASFEWSNGGQSVGFIPTRYPGSAAADEDAIRLARKTVWEEPAAGVYTGLGQRMFTTDVDDHPLLEVRMLVLDNLVPAPDGADAAAEATES